ncbi:MAG TPA: hypothetical protein VMR31_09755 [Myxococcota bacterium]|nr:hypothetical protein [Myxococcota bacterium]
MARFAYWFAAAAVTLYVALATGYRDELLGSDAWEHHRAVRVLAEVGLDAGNPTQDVPEPSIRYSPYSIVLALATRATGWDSYDVLSGAGVANTALLFIGLYAFLSAYGRAAVAPFALAPLLFLYGAPPGYANTLALQDLPVHQVNPSAFALWLDVFAWAAWRVARARARFRLGAAACAVLIACALLSHGMTGVLGALGLAAVACTSEPSLRRKATAWTVASLASAGVLCTLWPWYSFLGALRSNPDSWFWFNPAILREMLFVWCLPASLAAACALPYRSDEVVRTCGLALAASLGLGVTAIALHSATLARLPLAGLFFAQVLAGYVLWRWYADGASAWSGVGRALASRDAGAFAAGALHALLPAALVYFAVPQLWSVLREPQLLRPRIAKLAGFDDKLERPLERYRRVLGPVAEHDVVLADPLIAWPVPSVRGRIVAAHHLEFFAPGQRDRWDDTAAFLAAQAPSERRREILERYHVRWLLLDRDLESAVLPELLVPACDVSERDRLVLVDAACWVRQSLTVPAKQESP